MVHRAEPSGRHRLLGLLWALLPVAVFAVLFWYGRAHTPQYDRALFGQRGTDAMRLKAQLGTALLGLALVQVVLALWMYGRIPRVPAARPPVRAAHRLTGLAAFLLSLPIAQQCLVAYGVQLTSTRTALHSVAGCFLYGAFVAKVLVVRHRRLPGWALPVAGGALVCAVVVLWYTAAFWFLHGFSAPGL
ncbi:DUF6529 family protein [Kitasatospora camelliae]|uniref:DUF6529 family protein n=1 Tax=Kitasatospora camelliae TaxID=3156397 RepID=A0AAU8JUY8_9ACTN